MAEFTPIQFGKYLLLDRIGSGGMAELYRAKITGAQGFEKFIAIKKILPHLSSEERLVGAFIDEAKLAAFLHHQNIIQIYDFGCMEGTYFIAMEYLFGKDLKSVVEKAQKEALDITLENAFYIISKVCTGLDYAHKLKNFHGDPLNIIHRDIGPQNIFVTYEGQVKIIDFGIAKAASQNTKTLTGAIKGKVAYMSPEQAEGRNIDHRSDIFSIGILFYELVTHRRMFDGDTFQVFSKIRRAEFDPLEKVKPDLSSDVSDIIYKCLAKEPKERYQTCADILADLENCISGQSLRPTAVNLSHYMKSLFSKETEEEEQIMRNAAFLDASGTLTIKNDASGQGDSFDRTTTSLFGRENKRTRKFMAMQWVLFVIVAGVSVGIWLFNSHPDVFQQLPGSFTKQLPIFNQQEDKASSTLNKDKTSDVSAQAEKNAEARNMEKARALLDEGKFQQAVGLIETLLEKKPENAASISKLYVEALNGRAIELAAKNPEKAQQLLEKSIRLDTRNAAGHFQLGLLYTRKKAYKGAVSSYQKAVALNYRLPDVLFNLGYVYAVQKDYAKAEAVYQQVVDASPAFLDEALFNLSMVQVKMNKRESGIRNLEKAIKINPENNLAKKYLQKLKTKKKNK